MNSCNEIVQRINSCEQPPIRTSVRRIKPTRGSVSGVYMFRGKRAIEFESTLERDFIVKHEFFRDVQDVVAQPCRIEYLNPVSGRQNTYTPDFLVYYRWGRGHLDLETRPMLVEVKPAFAWKRHWREWAPKWKAARRYAEQQGMVFRIHDESRIRTAALENIRFLERFKDREYPLEVTEAVIETVREMGCVPYHYLLARFFMGIYRAEGIGHLWHLVATGHLQCDIYEPLSEFTELWVESNG